MYGSKECVLRAIEGRYPGKVPVCLDFVHDELTDPITRNIWDNFDTDMLTISSWDPEFVPVAEGYNEMGYLMTNFGETMGEVVNPPLEDWDNFDFWKAHLPDFSRKERFENCRQLRRDHPDKFLIGGLGMMMEELVNLRGYANCMIDYYEEEEKLCALIDTLYDMGYKLVDGYAESGMDAVIAWEDWGLQNAPMMSYELWERFYYDRMKRFVDYIHSKGMKYILHSCGHITYLMDTFVKFGIDVIQMDQQMNIGLDVLTRWKGKICFFCPIDIQHSVDMTEAEQIAYAHDLKTKLGSEKGGFMYKVYGQPASIHMTAPQLEREVSQFCKPHTVR